MPPADLDILCRVIDNYGDAGVVLRLARALLAAMTSRAAPTTPPCIRLFVDRPDILARLAPAGLLSPADTLLNPPGSVNVVTVGPAQESGSVPMVWDGRPAPVIIQAFDAALFAPYRQALEATLIPGQGPGQAPPNGRHLLINLEYLSAEDWTAEYHCLPSLSGIAGVDKYFFLPGFIPGTGGLLWGDTTPPPAPKQCKEQRQEQYHEQHQELRHNLIRTLCHRGVAIPDHADQRWWMSIFSYEHDYAPLIGALVRRMERDTEFVPLLFVAPGRSEPGFMEPWRRGGKPFPVVELPFLPQTDYDNLVNACDLNVVRGEESLARAALSGQPFLWHAYLQDEAYQMVKVKALLDRMEPFFDPPAFKVISSTFLSFNDRLLDHADHAITSWDDFLMLLHSPGVQSGFENCTRSFARQGNLAINLLDFIRSKGF